MSFTAISPSIGYGQSQDELQYSSDLHKDSIKTNDPSTNYPTCDSTCSNLEQYLLINDLMSKFMQRIDDKVEGISQEVNNLKANTINNLKREIDELKNENLELRQRNTTISYAMADLQTKVEDTENEKNSLITAIKLVQLDQSKPSGTKNQVDTWHVVRNKKPNVATVSSVDINFR